MEFEHVLSLLKNFPLQTDSIQKAQQEVAPLRNNSFSKSTILEAKKAGVLLLIHQKDKKAFFTLIERQEYAGTHSKQIALPGGKAESQDASIIQTALREAQEEVNIQTKQVEVVGQLNSIYIPPSNFHVTPVLAVSENQPNYIKQESEVKSILEIPVAELFHHPAIKETSITLKKGLAVKTPYLSLGGYIVWGATAMMLNEFRWGLLQK